MSNDKAILALIKIMEESDDPADNKKAKALRMMLDDKEDKPVSKKNQDAKDICPSCNWIIKHSYEFDWMPKHSNPDKNKYRCHYD